MSAVDEGRTEKATAKQRNKFRDEGSVAKSQELNNFSQFLIAYIVLTFLGSHMMLAMGELMVYAFTHLNISVTGEIQTLGALYMEKTALILLPLFIALIFSIIIISRVQFEFKISWKALEPKFSKLNPVANFSKIMISKNSMMELLKSSAKVIVVAWLAWITVSPMVGEFSAMFHFTPNQIGAKTWEVAREIWLMVIAFMAILGIADFSFQKYQLEEKMMMTKQQVKDEMKQQEGDVQVKGKIRQKGYQMIQNLMKQAATSADVVITNPTHFAVALSYLPGQMGAPRVVAKGVDHLALELRKIARKNEIPIVENRGLARAIYWNCDVNSEIPEKLFKPVAEILAFIYKLKRGKERKTS